MDSKENVNQIGITEDIRVKLDLTDFSMSSSVGTHLLIGWVFNLTG